MTLPPAYDASSIWGIDAALMSLTERIPAIILASLRVALTFLGLPAPFGGLAPMPIRTALSIVIALVLVIPIGESLPIIPLELAPLVEAAVAELFVGSLIGLTVRVTMAAAEAAGTFAGQAMGLGFAGSVDPTYGETVLPTAYLLDSLGALIFFSTGCHHMLLSALAASFRAAPIGAALSSAWRGSAVLLGTHLVADGLQIASPVIASMFIVQIGVAFVSRVAPRVHLFAFAFSISIGAGLVVLWVAAPAVCTALTRQVQHLPDALAALGTQGTQ
ncbi:MAG: flagellar biosynthetic protein FliR [Pseudomonadota bacterium]|jgi:flagellar biosynthetic protein FliR